MLIVDRKKKKAYYADEDEKWFLVVDGKEGIQRFDGFVGSNLVFDSPNRFYGVVQHKSGPEFIRVEVEISEGS